MSTPQENEWVVSTTASTFEVDVMQRSEQLPVILDFWAPWCAPCRALSPILEKLAAESGGRFLLVKANLDEMSAIGARFNVQGIPAVYAILEREIVDMFSGAVPESVLRPWLGRVLSLTMLREAQRLEDQSAAKAEEKYRELLAADANQVDAQIGLARALYAQDRVDEARAIIGQLEKRGYLEPPAQKLKATLDLQGMQGADVERCRAAVQANPDNLQAQLQLARSLAGTQHFEEALEILLSLVQRDRKNVGEQARQLMVEIFQALPDDSELTSRYRRKLSMALY